MDVFGVVTHMETAFNPSCFDLVSGTQDRCLAAVLCTRHDLYCFPVYCVVAAAIHCSLYDR